MKEASAGRTTSSDFRWSLAVGTDAVPAARHAFESWLRQHARSDDDVHDMAVVLSELASNAAIGAAAGTTGSIRARVEAGELHLEVMNDVETDDTDILRWDLGDPLRGGGRGLLIVRAYTDTMEVESAGRAVTVRCTRRLDVAP